MVERYTPTARIEIDGEDRTRPIWEHLESLTYSDAEQGEADSLEISVANDPPFVMPPKGAKVRLWMGYKEESQKLMGTFEVDETSVELKPAVMRIRARSASFSKGKDKQKEDIEWEGITLAELAEKLPAAVKNKTLPLVLCCASGRRSAAAVAVAKKLGHEKAVSLAGGLKAWREAGLPVEKS